MKYGPLGSSGVQVSEVCLGTVSHRAGGGVRAAPGPGAGPPGSSGEAAAGASGTSGRRA